MKHSAVFMFFIDLVTYMALNIDVKGFFFKEFVTHSLKIINRDKEQIDSV